MQKNLSQRERDKATKHLMKYVEKPKWQLIQQEYFDDMWSAIAKNLDTNDDELIRCLMDAGLLQNAHIYLIENVFTLHWEGEPMSMLEEYLKQRGWREKPNARQYMRALSQSTVGIYEVVGIKKGEYIDVIELTYDHVQRIYDESVSQNVAKWSWLAGRVLSIGKRKIFGGSILLISDEQIKGFEDELERYRDIIFEELKSENKASTSEKLSNDTMRRLANLQISSQIQDIIFIVWVREIYFLLNQARPVVRNKDNELYKDLTLKFSVAGHNNKDIIKKLNNAQFLDCVKKNKRWAWINCDKNNIPVSGTTLLGEFTLQTKTIKLTVNSDGRAQKGKEYLQSLLGESIAEPLIMENNTEKQPKKQRSQQPVSAEIDTNDSVTEEIIHAALTHYYKEALNEKINLLDNKTPIQCAKDKKMHDKLIQWLKQLEHSTSKATPHMQNYDFRWLWEELSLQYPKTK